MKCPSCGAETKSLANFCEYCGSEMPKDNHNINITNNYYGTVNNSFENVDTGKCPKCNSTKNVTTNDTTIIKGKGWLWWFFMFCIWPLALSVWFYKTDKVNIEKKRKIAIISIFWIFILIYAELSPDETQTETPNTTSFIERLSSHNDY